MPGYRFHCRNQKCNHDWHRYYSSTEFDRLQYPNGIGCEKCGYPKAAVMKSNLQVRDGFKPGWQSNIRKHCATYSEYKAHLKNMGLIEIGHEDVEFDEDVQTTNYWTPANLKKVYDQSPGSLGDNELNYLENLHKHKE